MASKKDNSSGAAKPLSKPLSKPTGSAKPLPKPLQKVTAKSAPKATVKSAPKPAAAKTAPKPAVKAAAVPAKKPAAKPAPAPAAKAAVKSAARIEPKAASKPTAKVDAKNDAKNDAKGASKPVTSVSAKPEKKVGAKNDPKNGAKNDPKNGAKNDPKNGAKVGAKAAAAPAVKGAPAAAKGSGSGSKPKPDPMEPPTVPKKGPIDLAQHKSVAAVAAAVANARGATESGEFIMINGRRVRAISTKGLTIAKKSKEAAEAVVAPPTEQQIASIKTKLAKKELDDYRTLLLAKRRQLVGMLSGMEDEALRSSGGNLSNMPVHMADMGSDVYEQDFTLGMAETERAILDEIDAALQRIEDKTFGVCQMTGKPISKARLDAKPWAKFTIEAERISESSGGR